MTFILFVLWICCAVAIGAAASRHYHRDAIGWTLLALLISPLLAGLFLVCYGHKRAAVQGTAVDWRTVDWNRGTTGKVMVAVPSAGPSDGAKLAVILFAAGLCVGLFGLILAAIL